MREWEDNQKLLEILSKQSFITEQDARRALEFVETGRGSVLDYLFFQEILSRDLLGQAIAEYYNVQYANLNARFPTKEEVILVPAEIGLKYKAVYFGEMDGAIVITTDDPTQQEILPAVKKIFKKKKVKLAFSLPDEIRRALLFYREDFASRFLTLIEDNSRHGAPLIVEELIKDALFARASDIHIEPREKGVEIRFRVDGIVQFVANIKHEYYQRILNRIKVLARLRTDLHGVPQDGSIRFETEEDKADIRVSIVPIFDGEKVVMRVLNYYTGGLSLNELGLSGTAKQLLVEASKKPFGMILTVGPTGSGKTTTLYGVLRVLNRPEVNIATIEDPIEYRMEGVNHMQVDRARDMTFSTGLRSLVRQDPDIILVGEIRDRETAEISVNAALTGHLLLSTFHANDAATAIPRLLDMGIEPFLLSSTLDLMISQRLVRKLCSHCRVSKEVTIASLKAQFPYAAKLMKQKSITMYESKGCNVCRHSGFTGRTAVFELLKVTPALEELIGRSPTKQEVRELAQKEGFLTMYEDGLEKVKSGVTTLEELERVVPAPKE